MAAVSSDPRPARSRARLLDAATALLRSGGPSAVTIDAVTRKANVARATLYRHFPSANDLVAAAFVGLIPPPPMPPSTGSLRERLLAIVVEWAESIAEAPTTLTAMAWLSLGPDIEQVPSAGGSQVGSLRERIAEQYSAPFDAVFDSPDAAAELRPVDRTMAFALLIGPLAFGRISTLTEFDYRAVAIAAVDGFLSTFSATNTGREGA
ncbi:MULTISPECIES: TetR/AcrR family transcriptional regulator [Mycolicibacterium]|uniref:Transcriptional regulator, TetR family n=3 Tax=Mycolicibacterium gilvum TaxID=1804 RepID=E6TEY2_MYCSR|nr:MULTISPECIES: TetR/AcrR family transcriptional regulator [Mycolicibacterium]ABP47520.1 transcriptional regulator, TetR family [Mycolicibacterium gilvum PYR-GCK]ADU01028.1 transcriptional regulator, TetR family [Mycolicibacterium gilvum Spyr1]MBV5242580.1 TetR/AcrR family transcriptional regulator [Mycolicibacterium sp. PAM1]MCV7058680.1 TetR/AcrR family transcriptional regulator [Mycolicibacterium gilvum]STZ41952.1 TetR family transcriptional regulator [Mycolicibacterium gilvum]